ncbi:MAG: hypothetical protein MJ178_08755 [Treponemataceae bacterium]|nr:hypothetical protein [Treponemataceae bacterium]
MKLFRHTLALCAAALFITANLFAQVFPVDYISRIWTASDGLAGNTITDLIQDRNGYIYLGTYEGLVRFDGQDFTVLNRHTHGGINCVSARAVFEDSQGYLWVGSNDEGLFRIDGLNTVSYTVADGLPSNSIRDICEDKNGNIWIGTAAGVVYLTKSGDFVHPLGLAEYDDDQGMTVKLYCDTAGRIWLSTSRSGGLYCYTSGRFTRFRLLDQYVHDTVSTISQDITAAILFGVTNNGLYRFDNGEITPFAEDSPIMGLTINDIALDSNNNLLMATNGGAFLYKGGKFYSYTESDGITDSNVVRIIEDREGNIWLGTDHGGIEKLSMGKFQMVNLNIAVNAIAEGKDQLIYVGTDAGLYCYDRKTDSIENDITRLCSGIRIRHVGKANNGDLLISCYSKLGQLRVTDDGITQWTIADGLAGDKVRVAIEDRNNSLWVGTTTGLSCINADGTITNYTRSSGLANDYIMALFEDSLGRLWVGTDGGGIAIFENGSIVQLISTEDGLAGNVIFKIMEDKNGIFWICTGTGISRFDGTSFFNYTTAEGLGTDSVFQMLIDYTDTVWMTSNLGISTASLESMNQMVTDPTAHIDSKLFNKNDGLRSGGVTSTSLSMTDSLGRIWFTLLDGFAVYDPVKIKSNTTLPLVHIETITVDDEVKPFRNDQVLVVSANTRRIDFKYTGLSYISNEGLRFKYQLEGFDKNWSRITSSRNVSYTNLKPGTYTFKVMAANSDGLWSETDSFIVLRKKAKFYEFWGFWLAVALFILSVIYSFFRLREKRHQATQKRLETMVQIKTIDLENEKNRSDRLLRNILPDVIAEELKADSGKTIAQRFDNVTILFADIVSFTQITAHIAPEDLVAALNDLFSRYDEKAKQFGIEKIKTMGDSYMAVCGLPVENPEHVHKIIQFARAMYDALDEYNKTAKVPFSMRIGINCGSVVAGVIGKSKFIYDLWGDPVNVAFRMQNLCEPGKLLVTDAVKESLGDAVTYESSQVYDVKGKGPMTTWTIGR